MFILPNALNSRMMGKKRSMMLRSLPASGFPASKLFRGVTDTFAAAAPVGLSNTQVVDIGEPFAGRYICVLVAAYVVSGNVNPFDIVTTATLTGDSGPPITPVNDIDFYSGNLVAVKWSMKILWFEDPGTLGTSATLDITYRRDIAFAGAIVYTSDPFERNRPAQLSYNNSNSLGDRTLDTKNADEAYIAICSLNGTPPEDLGPDFELITTLDVGTNDLLAFGKRTLTGQESLTMVYPTEMGSSSTPRLLWAGWSNQGI